MVAYNTNKAPENISRCFIRVWFSSFFLHHAFVAIALVAHVHVLIHVLVGLACRTLGFHVAEAVCEGDTESAASVTALRVAVECVVACNGVPASAVEQVAYVHTQAPVLVEAFAETEVE